MTPLQIATELCKPYATRGDDYNDYKSSCHGVASTKYWASVSGYLDGKKVSNDYIVISKINNENVHYIVKLKDAWSNALMEQLTLV